MAVKKSAEEMAMARRFGRNLKRILHEKGKTLSDLGRAINPGAKSPACLVSLFIHGKQLPGPEMMNKIASILSCTTTDLNAGELVEEAQEVKGSRVQGVKSRTTSPRPSAEGTRSEACPRGEGADLRLPILVLRVVTATGEIDYLGRSYQIGVEYAGRLILIDPEVMTMLPRLDARV